MKRVLTQRDIEEMIRKGDDLAALPQDVILTPSARDTIRDALEHPRRQASAADPGPAPAAIPPASASTSTSATSSVATSRIRVTSKSSPRELDAYFRSPECEELKAQMVDIGRRLWQRAYVDGNGGNLAIRIGEDLALCTPTLVSKGFMKPADMCLVDFEGRQLCGTKKRTSEILMHLQIMQRQPRAIASVHCHPPYATGFAVAGIEPPTCMIPEFEVFCAVAVAPYRTPGSPEMGKLVADLVDQHNTILMANHGVVSWSHQSIEDAYFKMEILEAYCRTILVASQLGRQPQMMSPAQLQDLLKIKQGLGLPDPRFGLKECELCDNADWRPGVTCAVPAKQQTDDQDKDVEMIVQSITDQIMARIQ